MCRVLFVVQWATVVSNLREIAFDGIKRRGEAWRSIGGDRGFPELSIFFYDSNELVLVRLEFFDFSSAWRIEKATESLIGLFW